MYAVVEYYREEGRRQRRIVTTLHTQDQAKQETEELNATAKRGRYKAEQLIFVAAREYYLPCTTQYNVIPVSTRGRSSTTTSAASSEKSSPPIRLNKKLRRNYAI